MSKSLTKIVSIVLALVFLITLGLTMSKVDLAKAAFINTSYGLMFLLLVLVSYQVKSVFGDVLGWDNIYAFLKREKYGLLFTLVATTMIFVASPPFFRVLSDETNLLSVSLSFVTEKTPFNITMSERYFGDFHALNNEIPTRPLMFPFAVSLLHELLGYNYKNVFVFNFIVLWVFLFLLFMFGKNIYKREQGNVMGLVTVFLVLSFAVFPIYATSGGFDLFSTLFLLLTLGSVFLLLKEPSVERLALVWIVLLFYSNIRYESIILIPLFFALFIDDRFIDFKKVQDKILFYLVSFFTFLPMLWQRLLTQGQYENPVGVPVVSMGSFKNHFIEMLKHLRPTDFNFPFSVVIIMLGLLGVFVVLLKIKKIKENKSNYLFLKYVFLTFCILNFIYFGHHFGVIYHPTQSRLFMSFSLFFVFSFLFALNFINIKIGKFVLVTGALAVFLVNHSMVIKGQFPNTLLIIREMTVIRDFLESQKQVEDSLYVYARPGQLSAMMYGAVDFARANENKEMYLINLNKKLYENIFVIQQINYADNQPMSDQHIDKTFVLEPLVKRQVSPDYYLLVSRVKPKVE